MEDKFGRPQAVALKIYKNDTFPKNLSQKPPKVSGPSPQRAPIGSYSFFNVSSNLALKYVLFLSSRNFFFREFLKSVTLSWVFPEILEILFHNVELLIEILYLDLTNLNGSML